MGNNTDWLTPKQYNPERYKQEKEIEQQLISLKEAFEKEIAKREQAKAAADDKGKFGTYRYLSGVIDGLNHASEIVSDHLASLWGM